MMRRSFVISLTLALGLIVLFVGERLIGSGTGRTVASSLGAVLVLLSIALRVLRMVRAEGERRGAERILLGLALTAVAGLLLYVAQSDLWAHVAGAAMSKSSPKLAVVLAALWPALMGLSLIPTLLVEMSYAAMQRAPRIESGRIRDALLSGVGFASILVFGFSAYYVASERDVKWDFSYFRTARPGEATRNVLRALDEKITVSLFFPPANEVREQVVEYLTDLEGTSSQFEWVEYDYDLEPKKARELGVTGNGTLVFQRGERKERMGIGLELDRARRQLRNFDQEFQKRLLTLARSRRTIYFTVGHGERTSDRMGDIDQRWTVRAVRDLYGQNNYDVKNLGLAEGLGSEVPDDAAAVVIAGPTEPFLPEELAALERFLDGGGRVMLALDPETDAGFDDLLARYGLRYHRVMLANDQAHAQRTNKLSDRAFIVTAAYSSHPAVTSLGRLGQRAPLLMAIAGHLEAPERKEGIRVDFTVHSHPSTWNDLDGNFEWNAPEEKRRVYELAAAVTKKVDDREARLLVFADSDALGDPAVQSVPGNAYLALDGAKWLLGDEEIAGEVSSEEDVPVQHTRKQDVAWFYGTIFAAPAVVLAFGFLVTRRGGRRKRKESAEAER